MKRSCVACWAVLIILLFVGCSRNTRAVKQSSARVQASVSSQRNAGKDLDDLSRRSAEAAEVEQIDSSTDREIQEYIARERANIEAHIQQLEAANQDIETYKSGSKELIQADVLEAANMAAEEASKSLRILEEKTRVIVDFLNNETFSKAEIGALFDPGEYVLPPSRYREATRQFTPIVAKLYSFAGKYQGAFKSLKGEIIVTGYSDATPIATGSALYRNLAAIAQDKYGTSEPSSSDLNLLLSELRAGAVRDLLERIIRDHQGGDTGIEINVRTLGRGETIPRGLPAHVAANDSRRRVVTFYWVVLPRL